MFGHGHKKDGPQRRKSTLLQVRKKNDAADQPPRKMSANPMHSAHKRPGMDEFEKECSVGDLPGHKNRSDFSLRVKIVSGEGALLERCWGV